MQDDARDRLAERTNRMSVELVRILLLTAVVLQIAFVVAFLTFLWINTTIGTTCIAGIIITAIWVAWLRMVEFERFRPATHQPTQRFRRPE